MASTIPALAELGGVHEGPALPHAQWGAPTSASPAPREKKALDVEVAELRAKLDVCDLEKQRLQAANAQLQDRLLLRAQQGAWGPRRLQTRWAGQRRGLSSSLGLSVLASGRGREV